ncbi:MAG TPA: aspartate aminotransferase family protein [Dehalococcoidales bacterium]|nr:aspartate aminotransferase family protein [Dehalococcoidales bacterium]
MTTDWQALGKKILFNCTNRIPVTLARGKGSRIWDDKDKEYIDFVGGWAVCSLGHCHPVIVEAVGKQSKILVQSSQLYYMIPMLQIADSLVKNSCMNRVFMCNSGLEANEGAVKLARRYGKLKLNGAYEVITALDSFHGRSLAMTAATGQPHYQEPYEPLPPGFKNVPFNNIEALKAATTEKTCAIMLEPVQGEGGVNIPSDGYLKAVRAWCDEKGILLILDEVQTGVGRLGTLWGYQTFGIEPDIMTLAKGLGGGIPVGAFLSKEHCAVFQYGDHGTTFGGNPLACATAYAVFNYVLEHDIPGTAKKSGQYLLSGMEKLKDKYPFISEVRGRGLLAAIYFKEDISQALLTRCLETGVLVNSVKPNAIRIMPALNIPAKDIDEGLVRLDKALAGFLK